MNVRQLAKFITLLLSCMCLRVIQATCAGAGVVEGEKVDPYELARQLRADICSANASQVQEFYKRVRGEENRDRQFPPYPSKLVHPQNFEAVHVQGWVDTPLLHKCTLV